MAVYPLNSKVQGYPWGSKVAIAELLGREVTDKPEAELWMGAHPRSPSPLLSAKGEAQNLLQLIDEDPVAYLGTGVASTYGRLPFLFKVLAADEPLSLQAHPTMTQAQEGFARENSAGIPLFDPSRNYKDASHKPELIYALSTFYALSGFRSSQESVNILKEFGVMEGPEAVRTLLLVFAEQLSPEGIERFFRGIFELSSLVLKETIGRAVAIAQKKDTLGAAAQAAAPWLLRLAELYPCDPGVLAGLLLNLVVLETGEAMYLPAGNLHAYLGGLGLEIMASSDNVLRGGLTSKHVDVPELCRILSFQSYSPVSMRGRAEAREGVAINRFVTPASEFELSLLELEKGGSLTVLGPEIWLILEGELQCDSSSTFQRGQQLFFSAESESRVRGSARIARASLE